MHYRHNASRSMFRRYEEAIRKADLSSITDARSIPIEFLVKQDGSVAVNYIPFDWVNPEARIVLVGITPGFTQWLNAVREAQLQVRAGADEETVLRKAKQTGAFSGSMRPNLVALLDHFNLHKWLGIHSCQQLFGEAAHLVQTTSALRYPVFLDGENYGGSTPSMTRHPVLRHLLVEHFLPEAQQLKNAVFVPLGPKVSEALSWLAGQGLIDGRRVLDGMPHPSGANAERINYILGKKARTALSAKTDPVRLDLARDALHAKVGALINET